MGEHNIKTKVNKSDLGQALGYLIGGSALLIYALVSHSNLQVQWGLSPYLFPSIVAVFIIASAILLFFEIYRNDKNVIKPIDRNINYNWRKMGISLVLIGIYYLVIPWFGFILTTIIFLIAMFWLLEEHRIWLIILLAVSVSFILYGLFHNVLHVMLP